MINQIINFSIKNKLLIGLMTVALIAGGFWSMTKVPLDAVPDITNNQVQVITQAPNLGTEDIEQFVTYPVEIAMSNLPGVVEIRSVSRFGLSVVTIVFEDDMGTYLPRQLVSEKLNQVKNDIPSEFGEPEMGPISTGLGEIYQYTLEVDEAHKDEYSPVDLRTIQDWIVKRQMSMVSGVVEVNAFGGDVKQYEVTVDPDKLKNMNVTMLEVFSALEGNNQNTGGAYIEKDHYANFIRGEGLARTLEDIEHIVIKNVNSIPITVKDVATVQFGKAIKYGSFTKDGKGEAVGGMILMLKGANSNDVINAVKERIDEIQKSLPNGVRIEPFLDRSDLIAKTTGTVSQNLIEGALIVIFVLVFLLGNWRGGLIVASTIPLSLLFAFILMHVFGVWANLMSLGAIDFGIIVDGAVIIVEGTVFLMHDKLLKGQKINAEDRDEIAKKSASKMMNSAFFGQLIILIVFIPILALQGVEGKMFKPMALTFMFAMIGVMILCLTYVPMMSAWFLRPGAKKKSWGDKLVEFFERIYDKTLGGVLKVGKWVVLGALTLLAFAVFTFSKMGGEFIPQLDEGDIAFHAILKPGSSLSETIETTTEIEQIVMEEFPEVKHIYSRIGVADVPTDPMPMDIADVFVILHPEDEWGTGRSKSELIDMMKERLEKVPGVNYEFTQPIEMRFNELITGVREDVAIKLYGDDLDILSEKVEEISKIIAGIDGIGDMKAEATSGLPQITVHYNRAKVAQYGLQINELNSLIQTAFAGGIAGVIFEGEKRFDLVVRLDEEHKQSIDDINNLYVTASNGSQIPMKEIADISYQSGPMQISRDNTNRRSYVGINVRGRDVKSLVEEIKQKLDAELTLPPGYYIRYGGAFENLERASARLQIVVPIALGLIFILILFALKSFKQSLMIYMAIPLAAIGGVFFLWMRGMPFSISAGVGFIVLFGVAVLNGLVLISGWNELKDEGVNDLNERIKLGAKRRIRPILLTALTDILGFLPMAISTSAGAEVQQPLATVVIGGMITATFLTLFVLPILYKWTEQMSNRKNLKPNGSLASILIVVGLMTLPFSGKSQTDSVITDVDQAITIGFQNNNEVKLAENQILLSQQNKKGTFNPSKTNFNGQYGQYNSTENDFGFSISQDFEFPTVYTSQWNLAKEQVVGSELELEVVRNKLRWLIRKGWNQLAYLNEYNKLLVYEDSLMSKFVEAAQIRYEVEETNLLEKVTAESKLLEIKNMLSILNADNLIQQKEISILLNDSIGLNFMPNELIKMEMAYLQDSSLLANNPFLAFTNQQVEIASAKIKASKAQFMPDLSVGYFNQSLIGTPTQSGSEATMSDRFTGVQFGINIPLFFGSYKSKIISAKIEIENAQINSDSYFISINNQFEIQLQQLYKEMQNLSYYEITGLPQSDLMIKNAQQSFESGSIDFMSYLQILERGIQVKKDYIYSIKKHNEAAINMAYLLGQ
ncbi:CusA/CzcA family heavy metal efflux RND transporter [Parvicella tangerina]|uniref:Multidrug resistance protein MdtC n=1 Tax=Parvicella tangerina TaxID=2829795 RepID=A0A916JPV4_9FLAO|nr:CusA/CzcA family heavy metal efflux RND transporter [Parvicella tangerina]CAG5085998.1 Multidrug resistance protein MdtC [Parvicella tangerina]